MVWHPVRSGTSARTWGFDSLILRKVKLIMISRKRITAWIVERFARFAGQKMPPFSTVAAVITNKDGKVLMIKLTYLDGYNLPGGGVSPGENLEEGLAREVREETNLKITSMKYFGSATEAKGGFHTLAAGFEVKIKNISQLKGSDEGEPEWMEPRAAMEKCHYCDSQELIKKYFHLS